MENIYKRLQESFELNTKHILVLKALMNRPLDAKGICLQTGIPQGRIYEHLNYLISNRLVERTPKKPFMYKIPNLNNSIVGFMKHRIDNMIIAQTEIMDLMAGEGLEHVDRIDSSRKFAETHLNMITESKVFRHISLHNSFPLSLYPMEPEMFRKMRQVVAQTRPTIALFEPHLTTLIQRTYEQALSNKRIEGIFEKRSLYAHADLVKKKLGKDFFCKWRDSLIENLSSNRFQVYCLDEHIPMQIDLNERRVSISVRHLGVVSGIVILSKELTSFYNTIFEQNLERSEDALPLIKKLKY